MLLDDVHSVSTIVCAKDINKQCHLNTRRRPNKKDRTVTLMKNYYEIVLQAVLRCTPKRATKCL